MRNLRKKKYISSDISFFKNHKPLKKDKVNRLEYDSRSSINWHEVKIILDATVVEKYLKNKKSVNEISITTPISNELVSRREKNSVPSTAHANKKINSVFSQRNNIMVKLEITEDIQFDNGVPEENFYFLDVPVKQEDYISVQDTDTFSNDPINNDKFAKSTNDYFRSQSNNNENHAPLTRQVAKVAFKNEIPESNIWHEEVTIGPEFKHEPDISQNYEATELIGQKSNNIAIKKASAPTIIRRSSRKRKICHNCDNCDHEVVKKSRTRSNVNKKLTFEVSDKNSNCNNKSRTSKTSRRKTLVHPQPTIKLFHCDHCGQQVTRKSSIARHIYNKHSPLFPNLLPCAYCKRKFQTMKRLEKHEDNCTSQFFLNCKFCSVSVTSKQAMKEHLIKIHTDEFQGRNKKQVIDEVWCDTVRDVITALEREGNTNKLRYFGIKFLKGKKYYRERRTNFIKFYCNVCNKSYEKSFRQKKKCCPHCNAQLLYQCRQCETTRLHYQSIWKHLRSKDSGCDISKKLSFDSNEERLINTPNKENRRIHNCEMCDYAGTTKSQLYKHIVSKHTSRNSISCKEPSFMCSKCGKIFFLGKWRFKRHEELCGIYIRYPCKFCPMTSMTIKHLNDHLSSVHFDELDGINIENITEKIIAFRNMMREVNQLKFKEKYSATTVADKTIDNSNYYLKGIRSILKPVCLKCNATVLKLLEHCMQCRTNITFQCLQCDECFVKYSTAWEHVTQICKNRLLMLINKQSNEDSVDHCTFKNSSQSVLSRHVMHIHKEPMGAIGTHFTCLKCDENFNNKEDFNCHKLKCRINYIYDCHFCPYSARRPGNIKGHMIKWHSHYFHRDDKGFDKSLHDSMLKVVENRRMLQTLAERLTETDKLIRRKLEENIELVRFYCQNCNETFEKDFSSGIRYTKQCLKCQSRLMLVCKICEKVYSTLTTISNHFSKNVCPGVKPSKIPSHQLDHSYVAKDPLDHSYASNFTPLDTENDGNF